jgi:hypothetical protein
MVSFCYSLYSIKSATREVAYFVCVISEFNIQINLFYFNNFVSLQKMLQYDFFNPGTKEVK